MQSVIDGSTHTVNNQEQMIAALTPATHAYYKPPGLLGGLVENKRREVDTLYKLPEAREDGPWGLRLAYPAAESSFKLARAIGYKSDRLAVIADLKRSSPGEKLGLTEMVDERMSVTTRLQHGLGHGLNGVFVSTDLASYGGSTRDLVSACQYLEAVQSDAAAAMPVVAKDLIIDPIQIAQAASQGADAVLIIAAAAAEALPELLDTCTLLGLEAVVEVHTPDEIRLAAESYASLLLVTDRDRATGRVLRGHAAALAPLLPPETTCLACGGITRLDQVRTLRAAGYDGVVLGRVLASRRADELLAEIAADNAEPPSLGRLVEVISAPQPAGAEAPQPAKARAGAGEHDGVVDVSSGDV